MGDTWQGRRNGLFSGNDSYRRERKKSQEENFQDDVFLAHLLQEVLDQIHPEKHNETI